MEKNPSLVPIKANLMDLKAELARRILRACRMCERACGVDRIVGMSGVCGVKEPRLSSEFLHLGEESELIPSHTFFFSGCTFKCVYCQNQDISQDPEEGVPKSPDEVATIISASGGVNVNWVGGDPNPQLQFIMEVLRRLDTNISQVWNSNMYASKEAMALLDGAMDLYLADFKYGNDACAKRLSGIDRYMEVVGRNHIEASRQCEMIIRHLVLPGHIECCSIPVLDWIAKNLDLSRVRVNVMDQYRPTYKVPGNAAFKDIARPLSHKEFLRAYHHAESLGLDLC